MSDHQTEIDQIVALFYEHQRVGTLTDACTCGAGDIGTLCESGIAVNRHWRHLALVLLKRERERMSEAWDEAKWATYSAEREGRDGSELVNPHRFPRVVTPPGLPESEC